MALSQPFLAPMPQLAGSKGTPCLTRGSTALRPLPPGDRWLRKQFPHASAHLLNIVVEATDGKAGVVVILPNALRVLLGEMRPGLSQRRWHTCSLGSCLGIH